MNYDLSEEQVKELDTNPTTNHNAIVVIKQEDGNWRGFMWKNGKLVQERQADPSQVVQLLLTHP